MLFCKYDSDIFRKDYFDLICIHYLNEHLCQTHICIAQNKEKDEFMSSGNKERKKTRILIRKYKIF